MAPDGPLLPHYGEGSPTVWTCDPNSRAAWRGHAKKKKRQCPLQA